MSFGVSFLVIFLLMVVYYNTAGWVANIALILNILFTVGILAALGFTLTAAGIAGLVPTIGMAVDANVLIFERIREELDAGRSPRSALDAGFKRATVTILDSNITTLIAALVLYQFGTGPVRGFAVTLSIGIIGSMFCAIVFARYIMEKTMIRPGKNTMSI